jgi:threonine/homoserine/homoserine lactone efflux protein
MWGSGLGHGFLMMVGWLLGLIALAAAVYFGVALAMRRYVAGIRKLLEESLSYEQIERKDN